MKRKKRKWSLYQKFALVMILLGLFPMLILSTFIVNRMMEGYRQSMEANYEQAAIHMSSSVENMLVSYDSASKTAYQYNFGSNTTVLEYGSSNDNLRQVLTGELYAPETLSVQREKEMDAFLEGIENTDAYIFAAHFLTDHEQIGQLSFHLSLRSTYFKDEEKFQEIVQFQGWDKESKKLQLIPTHATEYFNGMKTQVFTVARNYFDLRGPIGKEKYVGTVFIDVDTEKLKLIFKKMHLGEAQDYYLVNENGDCFYSSKKDCIGKNLEQEGLLPGDSKDLLLITTDSNDYGLKIIMEVDTRDAFRQFYSMQLSMYIFLIACGAALLLASIYFSRRLTRPIHNMMEQMSQLEGGNFDIELPVESEDEIGVLSQRFNQMSRELKNYINQSYVAQIKQNEAELTALKSQIYPHFLYNTLEIIRMTALESNDVRVSKMIEALSEQIHYLIGPVKDMVPLEKEINIIRKYVYLLNCRIAGKVILSVEAPGSADIAVPRLILQPIVENAYVHGIKPKNGRGSILIEAARREDRLEISVMDNGIGMEEETLKRLRSLLDGEEPGVKNEYNWQSIGLKNVHDRVRYLYGESYGVRVTSTVGIGTIVQVLLPWQEMEKGDGVCDAENDFGGR